MKNLKMIFASLLVLSLTACSSSNAGANASPGSQTSGTDAAEKQESSKPAESEVKKEDKKEITFESFDAVDNDECKIVIKDLDPKGTFGYTVNLGLENKSEDKTYMFAVDAALINGVDCPPLFATEVAPGKKANKEMIFATSTLEKNGIKEFTDIQIMFRVYDSNDWSADNVAKEEVHIYPYGEENAVRFVREQSSEDTVLVDNDSITALVTGIGEDDIWGYTVYLYLVNKTNSEVMFSVDNASVNGYMADPFFAKQLLPNSCAFASMSWADKTLAENDIKEVKEIEFDLRVYDSTNWTGGDILKETFTLNP